MSVVLSTLVATTALAVGPAQAVMVAGWDFSQYLGDGLLSTDGATFSETLDANYSNLDPTFGAGAESAAFGTLYMDGSNGSDAVGAGSGSEAFLPSAGSLASNQNEPVVQNGGPPQVPFDTFTVLTDEGQAFTELLGMTAPGAISVVFGADLSSIGGQGANWMLSLGGVTFGSNASVAVEFSTDGASYAAIGALNLTSVDSRFELPLDTVLATQAFVRLTFATPGGAVGQAKIDNLAINADVVPEPGTLLLLGVGLAGLELLGRRRRA